MPGRTADLAVRTAESAAAPLPGTRATRESACVVTGPCAGPERCCARVGRGSACRVLDVAAAPSLVWRAGAVEWRLGGCSTASVTVW